MEEARQQGEASAPNGSQNGATTASLPKEIPACHYEALGVQASATDEEVKKAYYQRSKQYHPDKNPDPKAKVFFQRVNEAYQLLKNPRERKNYDGQIYAEKVYATLGSNLRPDPLVVSWIQQALQVPGASVDCLPGPTETLMARILHLIPHVIAMTHVDIKFCQTAGPRSVLFICGMPHNVQSAKRELDKALKEATGETAPSDGLMVLVPAQNQQWTAHLVTSVQRILINTMSNLAAQSQVYWPAQDRIVVRCCPQATFVVATLQKNLNFQGIIVLPNGQKYTAWEYAHACEAQEPNSPHLKGLVPEMETNDPATVRSVIKFALKLGANAPASLVQLVCMCLKPRAVVLTNALLKVISSAPVHTEYTKEKPQQQARLLACFAELDDSSHQKLGMRFQNLPHMKVLRKMRVELGKHQESLFMRSRAYVAAKEAVPADDKWHSWDDVLRPDGPLGLFYKTFRKHMVEKFAMEAPVEGHSVPEVMGMLLKACGACQVDLDKGLFRKPEVQAEKPRPWATAQAAQQPATKAQAAEEGEDSLHLTLVERVEDVLLELAAQKEDGAYLKPEDVTKVFKDRRKDANVPMGKEWWQQHIISFELKWLSGEKDFEVRLREQAKERSQQRTQSRERANARRSLMQVAVEALPKLSEKLPSILSNQELCALLVQMGDTKTWSSGLPAAALAGLTDHQDQGNKSFNATLLKSIVPFHAAHLLRSVVSCEKSRANNFKAKGLMTLLEVAALEVPDAVTPLEMVRDCLRAACHKPFKDLLKDMSKDKPKDKPDPLKDKPDFVRTFFQLACLRLRKELAHSSHLSHLYSTFTCFAEAFQSLANLYSNVQPMMRKDEEDRLITAFTTLRNELQRVEPKQAMAPIDPQGLHRLAWAFANLGQAKGDPFRESVAWPALQCLAKMMSRCELSEAGGWNFTVLCTVISSYWTAGAKANPELFGVIAQALAQRVKDQKEVTLLPDQVLRIVTEFRELGHPELLDGFLSSLHKHDWLKKQIRDAPKDLHLLLGAMLRVPNGAAMDEFNKFLMQSKDSLKKLTLQNVIYVMKELAEIASTSKTEEVQDLLWKAAIAAMESPGSKPPAAEDVENLLQAAPSESAVQTLRIHFSRGAVLDSIPKTDQSWKQLVTSFQSTLRPFARAKERVPRLESACGARLLQFIFERPPGTGQKRGRFLEEVAPAALEIPFEALASMPCVVALISESLKEIPHDDKDTVRALVQHLLNAVKHKPDNDPQDKELELWVQKTQAMVDDGKPGAKSLDEVDILMAGKENELKQKMKQVLGKSWLTILLARSREITWNGGDTISLSPPCPLARLHSLGLAQSAADKLGPLQKEVLALKPEKIVPKETEEAERKDAKGVVLKPGAGAAAPAPKAPAKTAPEAKAATKRPAPMSPPAKAPPQKRSARGSVAASLAKAKAAHVQPVTWALMVDKTQNKPLENLVNGRYARHSALNSRDVFKRMPEKEKDKDQAMFIYFWDEEPEPGWWFGTEIGGEQVLLYNKARTDFPPADNWQLAANDEVDQDLRVTKVATAKPPPPPKATAAKPKANKPGPRIAVKTEVVKEEPQEPTTALKRPREEPADEDAKRANLKEWLLGLDRGAGNLLQYEDGLMREFDGNMEQIAMCKIAPSSQNGAGQLAHVDPSFFQTLGITKMGHKVLFAKGIVALNAP